MLAGHTPPRKKRPEVRGARGFRKRAFISLEKASKPSVRKISRMHSCLDARETPLDAKAAARCLHQVSVDGFPHATQAFSAFIASSSMMRTHGKNTVLARMRAGTV